SLGNQRWIDGWYSRLSETEPGVRPFGVSRLTNSPAAQPPTLTLFVGHPAIDLKQLEFSSTLEVSADISPSDREDKENDAAIKTIEEFLAKQPANQTNP